MKNGTLATVLRTCKPAINDISLKMVAAFEKRDAEFTAMHKKAARMQKLSEHQKKIDTLSPQQYERETFPLSRPMRDDVRCELDNGEAGGGDAYYLPLPGVRPETMGSRLHPGPLCHQETADIVAEFLREIL